MLNTRDIQLSDRVGDLTDDELDVVIIPGRGKLIRNIGTLKSRELERESFPIVDDVKIIIAFKDSLWNWDKTRLNLNTDELRAWYEKQGSDWRRIEESHKRQQESLTYIQNVFPNATILSREEIKNGFPFDPTLVIALGGDNHAQYVSHRIKDDTPFLGINSDPQTSSGATLQGTIDEVELFKEQLSSGTYQFIPFTKIEAIVNDTYSFTAMCDVLISDELRMIISRYFFEIKNSDEVGDNKRFEMKNSGLLVSSGSGSTGWTGAAFKSMLHYDPKMPPDTDGLIYIATESLNSGTEIDYAGVVRPNEHISLTSRLKDTGFIVPDSLKEDGCHFPRGSIVKISISKEPLWVIGLNRI